MAWCAIRRNRSAGEHCRGGHGLASIPVVVERKVLIRSFAAKITRTRLQFLHDLPQGPGANCSGYKGFFYHFLDIESGRRVWQCELSTIDSAFLFAGALTAATYFDNDSEDEREIRRLADALYRNADWNWARNGEATLTHGWRPETGFIPYRWQGYDEGLLLYILGLGSPTHSLPAESYAAYCATYQWKAIYGRELLYCGPLFTHQLSHLWIDFRDLRDAFMREHNSDYFQNSRQATFVQQEYAIRNPLEFAGYGKHCWGFTACDGPGNVKRMVSGIERQFYDYIARGVPMAPMMAPSPLGSLSLHSHLHRRSSSRRFAISLKWTWAKTACTVSNLRLIRRLRIRIAQPAGGFRRITSESTRDRLFS